LGFAGDYGCYDGTLMPDLMWRSGEIMKDWYREYLPQFNSEITIEEIEEHMLIIDVIMSECLHVVEVCSNSVYMSIQGNKSGNPWTALINTLVNIMYSMCAWREITRGLGHLDLVSLDCFDKHVTMFSYGDDNIFAVSEEALDFYNAENYSISMGNHGIKYTDENKTDEIVPFKEIFDCGFLKNRFRRDENFSNLVHPLMSKKTIYQLVNWVRKSPDDWEALYSNLGDAFEFMMHYGEIDFNKFKSDINRALRALDKKPMTLRYGDLYNTWLQKHL